jgi:hypothetical protein
MKEEKSESGESDSEKTSRGITRRDMLIAGAAGLVGYYTGVIAQKNKFWSRVAEQFNRPASIDPNRGGLIDEVFEHPELKELGPTEYEDDGKIVKVEQYYSNNFFLDPGHIYTVNLDRKESPVEIRIRLEERLTENKLPPRVLNYFNNVSNETGRILMKRLGASNIDEANKRASSRQFYEAIAEAFRRGNAVYMEEELLAEAFNPAKHKRMHIHLDCNLLAEGFAHVAMNYGRRAGLMIGDEHMFVVANGNEVEATAFRDRKVTEETRRNKKGAIPYTVIEHTDSITDLFWKNKGFRFKNDCIGTRLRTDPASMQHNLRVFQRKGKYISLTQEDLEEVIEGAIRGHLFIQGCKGEDLKSSLRIINEYIEFAKTVKNPHVAIQGFNWLSTIANFEIKSFEISAPDYNPTKSVANLGKMIEAMRVYRDNHEVVREKAKGNARRMGLQLAYMKDPANLDKALATFDREGYNSRGKAQIDLYTRGIKKIHSMGRPDQLASAIHLKDISREITTGLNSIYFKYIARNHPEKKKAIYDSIETEMNGIIKHAQKQKADSRIIENLQNIRDGKSFYQAGPVFEAAPVQTQKMYNLAKLREIVK